LEGESLEHRLERRGRLTPSETAHVLREMARGVDRAHAAGIVHRDLKPPNVFLARVEQTEVVKVLDFGIAKMLGATPEAHVVTQAGYVLGTPAYMSPEQVLGRAVDPRADLWSMAVIAFECVTGVRPFEGETLGQLFMAVCNGPMPVPSEVAAAQAGRRGDALGTVPPGFDAWFARAASRDPAGRFASAGAMADALGALLAPGGVGESAVPTVARSKPRPNATVGSTGRSEAWSAARVEPARRAAPVALIVGFLAAPLLALCAFGAVAAFRAFSPRPAAAPTSVASADGMKTALPSSAPPSASADPSPPASAPSTSPASATARASASAASSSAPLRVPRAGGKRRPDAPSTPIDLGI
jgi:serine/threonine-protein kinase